MYLSVCIVKTFRLLQINGKKRRYLEARTLHASLSAKSWARKTNKQTKMLLYRRASVDLHQLDQTYKDHNSVPRSAAAICHHSDPHRQCAVWSHQHLNKPLLSLVSREAFSPTQSVFPSPTDNQLRQCGHVLPTLVSVCNEEWGQRQELEPPTRLSWRILWIFSLLISSDLGGECDRTEKSSLFRVRESLTECGVDCVWILSHIDCLANFGETEGFL